MRAALFALAALACAGTADAATYVGTRNVLTGSAQLSITTDGTIGVLSQSNIVDYTINLFNTDGTFTLTRANSAVLISGNAFTATATQLLFDFSSFDDDQFALFQAPSIGSGQTFYCVQTSGCFEPAFVPGEAVEATTDFIYPSDVRSGNQVLATIAGVPEPASWLLMVAGFGAVGAAMRRRTMRMTVSYT